MSETSECQCEFEENCKDDTEHYRMHLISELSDINKQLGQANMLTIESHNLIKDHGNQITVVGSLIAFSLSLVSWTLISIYKKN